jgi:hypothetical protein
LLIMRGFEVALQYRDGIDEAMAVPFLTCGLTSQCEAWLAEHQPQPAPAIQ